MSRILDCNGSDYAHAALFAPVPNRRRAHEVSSAAREDVGDSRKRMQRQVLAVLDALPVLHRDSETLGRFDLGHATATADQCDALGDMEDELLWALVSHVESVTSLAIRPKPSYMMVFMDSLSRRDLTMESARWCGDPGPAGVVY
jgi:hypothetical protein